MTPIVTGYIAKPAAHHTLDRLRADTAPLPGRPGWRVDRNGATWYSDAWLNQAADGIDEHSQLHVVGGRVE